MYFAIILCPNFRVLETARILWDYKYKEKVECLPLALSSKPYVVVLQTTAINASKLVQHVHIWRAKIHMPESNQIAARPQVK